MEVISSRGRTTDDDSASPASPSLAQELQWLRAQAQERASHSRNLLLDASNARSPAAAHWLRTANVEVLEVLDPDTTDGRLLDELYAADQIYFVTDTYTLSRTLPASTAAEEGPASADATLSLLAHFAAKPGTRLLVNHTAASKNERAGSNADVAEASAVREALEHAIGSAALRSLETQCTDVAASSTGTPTLADPTSSLFLRISTAKALQAHSALRAALSGVNAAGATTRDAWDAFATGYTGSRIGVLKTLLQSPALSGRVRAALTASPSPSSGANLAQASHLQSALFVLQRAVEELQAQLSQAWDDMREAEGAATVLQREAEEGIAKHLREVLGAREQEQESSAHAVVGLDGSAVRERAGDRSRDPAAILADSAQRIEMTLSRRLPWWKLPWKVDDVRAEMEAAVGQSFAKDLERNLIFEAGKLRGLTGEVEAWTTKILHGTRSESEDDPSTAPSAFLSSSLLRNQIEQQASTKENSRFLTVDCLAWPISTRREQLFASGGPVDMLAARAQSAAFQAWTLTLSTTMLSSYSAYLAPRLFDDAIGTPIPWYALPMQPSTAWAVTMLALAISALRLQGKWGNAKKRFWRDWSSLTRVLDSEVEVSRTWPEINADRAAC